MSVSHHWIFKIAARMVASALASGVFVALSGALCVATAGALLGWILDLRSTPPSWGNGFIFPGAWLGAFLGVWSGIIGVVAGAVAACSAPPHRALVTLRALLRRIALGQLLATLGAVSSYLVFAWAVAQWRAQEFIGTVEDQLGLALWGVPMLMICGAIVGAVWKRD